MFVRKSKKRSSLQLAPSMVTRLRKQHKTCVVINEEDEENQHKKLIEALTTELRDMIFNELELKIEEIERWNRDKYMIARLSWEVLDVHIQPTVEKQPKLTQDEEPECPNQKMVWRKRAMNAASDKRLALNAATGLTKLNFYHWGRETVHNSDSLVPLDMSLQLPMRKYDPEENQLSELRRDYLQRLKASQEFSSNKKRPAPPAQLPADGRSLPRQKQAAKPFTFDYNGNKYDLAQSRISQQRRKETVVQSSTFEPGQFEVKDLSASQSKAAKLEKFENRAEEDNKYKNLIKDVSKGKEKSIDEGVVPSKLETGVSIYVSKGNKKGSSQKEKATSIISGAPNVTTPPNETLALSSEQRHPAVMPRKESHMLHHNSSLDNSHLSSRHQSLLKVKESTNRTERTNKNSIHNRSRTEQPDRILLGADDEVCMLITQMSKENIRNLFKVTLTYLAVPNSRSSFEPAKKKFIQDLGPTPLKLPRIQ